MSYGQYDFEVFSSKEGFNSALGHFQTVSDILGDLEDKVNLADLLSELLNNKEIEQNQLAPTVKALLVDKYSYSFDSLNMFETLSDFTDLCKEVSSWKALDLVVSYLHPELGYTLINPKNPEHWAQVREIKRNELVTIYAGTQNEKGVTKELAFSAINLFIDMLKGKTAKTPETLKKGSYKAVVKKKKKEPKKAPKAQKVKAKPGEKKELPKSVSPAQKAQEPRRVEEETSSANKRMTPFYSVPVTNELFHNGNVEAWKKIIQSYNAKHPDLDVYIFYDGEKINDIHSLFKWGKVKHGSTILFSVAGENIQDVAKLQRYLRQGASPRFEDFLRFPVNTVLKLF